MPVRPYFGGRYNRLEMPSAKNAPPQPPSSELAQAAEKASLVIRGLQSRLQPKPAGDSNTEVTRDDLERQLQQYFARAAPSQGALADLRNRVVDGVVDRILSEWDRGSPLEAEVLDRLVQRLLERYSP